MITMLESKLGSEIQPELDQNEFASILEGAKPKEIYLKNEESGELVLN